jgi:hypothetical protein
LITTVCTWEYNCCDSGEARYELGPTIGDIATCKEKFVYELHTGNAEKGPFPQSTIYPILNTLGYEINLTNVTENAKGITQCVNYWKSKACNATNTPTAKTHCTATTYGIVDPCSLSNLVKPKLAAGDTCNLILAENATRNDIECVAGTTCVAANTDDNLSNLPKCITRGQANVLCDSDKNCDFNYYCNFTTGKCTEKGDPGDSCSYKNESAPQIDAVKEPCKAGLTCNPTTKKCIEDCKTDYVCNDGKGSAGDDYLCASGESCLPTTIGDDANNFKVCGKAESSVARCNSAEDCGSGYYCKGTTCAAIGGGSSSCTGTTERECGPGLYCKVGTTSVCTSYTTNGGACTPDNEGSAASIECDPSTALVGCVYNASSLTAHVCSATLIANGSQCTGHFECASGRCEVGPADTVKRCTAGAALNAACDDEPSTNNALICGEGLTCLDGSCVLQVGPGGNCDVEGSPSNAMCTNGYCNDATWMGADVIMCTSAAVPTTAGGTNVTCDGNHKS